MIRLQPDDINIVFGLPPETFDFDVIGIDSEFFGQQKEKLHRPHGKFGCLGMTTNGKDVYMIFDTEQIQEFYNRIDEGMHCYHNAKYDITQLRPYANIPDRKKIWDSQLIEQIRFSGLYTDFALNDLARRYLKIYLPKDVRESFEDDTQEKMTDDQIFYAACDIVVTWMVAKAQMEQIDEDDLNIWKHIERDFLWTLLDTPGIYFDAERWTKRYKADLIAAEKLDQELPFNPRSPKQVKEYFKEKYKLTLDGTSEPVLIEVAEEYPDIPELKMILDARGLSKASKTYGASWVENMEADGRIYPNWKQMVETGRMSCPGIYPIQTMPHDPEYRGCVIAAPGHKLSIHDYSSQEPRILAYITQDNKLISIFQTGKDVYITIGFEVFEEEFDKKDERRKHMKTIVLGIPYGMGSCTLAKRMGQEEEYAEELLRIFFKKFPKVKKWVDETTVWKPYATTILGRKFWLNPYSNGWDRNAKNFPCQGSASDCTKIAANKLRKKLNKNYIVVYLHDELVAEFPEEHFDEYEKIKGDVMVEVQEWMHEGISGGVEAFSGNDWSAK